MAAIKYPFPFDAEKGIETVAFIASRLAAPTLLQIFKILYFADRRHLARGWRFICHDNYVAMKNGPVPSGIYDIAKAVRGEGRGRSPAVRIVAKARGAFVVFDNHRIRAKRDADRLRFSESDLEALNWAIKRYGACAARELSDLSHDAAWRNSEKNRPMAMEEIVRSLPAKTAKSDLLDYLRDPLA